MNEFWWHNYVDGSASTEEIKRQAERCYLLALVLDAGVKTGILKIVDGESQPSLTRWDVLDEEAYVKLCEKCGLVPADFAVEGGE